MLIEVMVVRMRPGLEIGHVYDYKWKDLTSKSCRLEEK